MALLRRGSQACSCSFDSGRPKLIALTGGPGAGKTAVLELAAHCFCAHVAIMPEAASVVFGGGFPRHQTLPGRCAAQRAIFHIQREVEELVLGERRVAIGLCDRGTVDGAAYWPGGPDEYWEAVGTTAKAEMERYAAVVHLGTPSLLSGYVQNPLRVESPDEAARLDRRVAAAWNDHPKRVTVSSRTDFLAKALAALELIRLELPDCCRSHLLPGEMESAAAEGGGA